MTLGPPTQSHLDALERRRTDVKACAESLLLERRAEGIQDLDAADSIRFRAMQADLQAADDEISEYRRDLERSQVPERYANLGKGGSQGAAAYSRQWSQRVAEKLVRTMSR